MPSEPSLGAAIRARRIEMGLTQEQLAQRIGGGIKQAEISRLESGRIALPRRARLERISIALDISLGELLARSGWTGAEQAFGSASSPTDPTANTDVPTPSVTPFDGLVGTPDGSDLSQLESIQATPRIVVDGSTPPRL